MGSMLSGINNARMHSASLEHDKWKTVTNNSHEERMAVVNHVLGEAAKQNDHGRHKEFLGSVLKHAEGGTPVNAQFGDVSLGFTRKSSKPKGSPSSPNVPQSETPSAPKGGPVDLGMPAKSPVKPSAPQAKSETPAPAAPTEAPAKVQKYAHRDPVTKKITHYADQPQVMPAKKATKTPTAREAAKKAAQKKKK